MFYELQMLYYSNYRYTAENIDHHDCDFDWMEFLLLREIAGNSLY